MQTLFGPPPEEEGLIRRFQKAVESTRTSLMGRLDQTLEARPELNESLWEELEEALILGDVGVATATEVVDGIRQQTARGELRDASEVKAALRGKLTEMIGASANGATSNSVAKPAQPPLVVLVVGVNGTGKTTTIGRLAWQWSQRGSKVLLCAGDTFRAAAIEQLEIWGERAGSEVIKQKPGADPSAVIFDGLTAAKARGSDVVIVDTAGRLHTKTNLMAELDKVKRTCAKVIHGAPHEVLLVMDATTGQNGLQQARMFTETAGVTGIVLTKLDGTAKGGVVLAIARELKLPIRYVGVGEQKEDLIPFDAQQFVASLFA